MRGILLTVVFILVTTVVAVSQVTDKQSTQTTDEQEIISLSRRFADEAVINDATVVKHTSSTNHKSVNFIKDGEANSLAMEQISIKINGNRATLASQLAFSGRRTTGDTYKHVHSWTVNLIKQAAGWKVIDARMGSIDK